MYFRFASSHDIFRCNQLLYGRVLSGNTVHHFRRSSIYYSTQHKFGPSSLIGRRIRSRIQGTKRIMSVDVISFCMERVLFGNTIDHFQRSWIYYSFSTQVLILAILLKSVLYYSSHENERLTKLTTFETRCKRRSKLDTKASHKCSLDFSVCLAGRVLKNLPQELNGKSRPCKKQTKEKFYKM